MGNLAHPVRITAIAIFGVICTLVVSNARVTPAQAAFPGANGKILFQSSRDGNAEIYSMNPNGSDIKNLTMNPAADRSARWSPSTSR